MKYWLELGDLLNQRSRVKIRYIKNLLEKPILIKDIKDHPIINRDTFLVLGHQTSTMPLKEDAFWEIIKILKLPDYELFGSTTTLSDIESSDLNIEDDYINAIPEIKKIISNRIERGAVAQKVKEKYNYECLICKKLGYTNYKFSKRDNIPYIEAHHIEFVSKLKAGSLAEKNIITLCANHHRQIHFGNVDLVVNNEYEVVYLIDSKEIKIEKS